MLAAPKIVTKVKQEPAGQPTEIFPVVPDHPVDQEQDTTSSGLQMNWTLNLVSNAKEPVLRPRWTRQNKHIWEDMTMFEAQKDLDHLDYEAIKRQAREERARYSAKIFKVYMSKARQFVRRHLSVPQPQRKKQQVSRS